MRIVLTDFNYGKQPQFMDEHTSKKHGCYCPTCRKSIHKSKNFEPYLRHLYSAKHTANQTTMAKG